MISRFTIVLLLTSVVIATSFSTCRRSACEEVSYNFEVGMKIFPDRDSVRLNDTVWLQVDVPSNLRDLVSSKMIDYSNAENLGTDIALVELTGNASFRGAFGNFHLYLEQGKLVQSSNDSTMIRDFLFNEANGNYIFLLGLIPLQKGIFRASWGNAVNVYRRNDKCTKADFSIVSEQTNAHSYFNTNNFPGIVTDSTHMYCFKVY